MSVKLLRKLVNIQKKLVDIAKSILTDGYVADDKYSNVFDLPRDMSDVLSAKALFQNYEARSVLPDEIKAS